MFGIFGDKKLISADLTKQILHSRLTPLLADYGLRWNGSYLWFGDSKDGIRKVVQYTFLKGSSGTLKWGVCLDFIPTISGGVLRWHRTEKSMMMHLFDWPVRFDAEKNSGGENDEFVTHYGKKNFDKSLLKHFESNKEIMLNWFGKADSIKGLIGIVKEQMAAPANYSVHSPDIRFILAFLLARSNKMKESSEMLESLDIDLALKPKIAKLLADSHN